MKNALFVVAILIFALRLPAQTNVPVGRALVPKITAPRIALMDFVSDDNSYRSTVALGNLVSALQVEISGDTNYDWVERAELEKAANEFKLTGLGLVDRSEAIRSGLWVKADWGIFGSISTNTSGYRTLSLEIVNLQRADVLAVTNLLLPSADSGPFQMKSEYVPNIVSTLRTLLDQAHNIYSESEKQGTVAFLFLSLNQSGSGDAFGDLDADFRRSLLMESMNSRQFHLVQFQRAGAAMDEASLVLSGLAETDSNSWQKVADHYIWGDARVNDQKFFDWNTKDWRDERKLDVKLNVWDGRGEPQIIALTVTNETSEALAKELTKAIEPLLRRDRTKPIVANVRDRISDSIFAQYSGLPVNFWFDSPEGRRQWFDAVQLLETACLFNPGNTAAREQLLRLRWGTALPGYNAGSPAAREELGRLSLTQELKSASRNEFFFVRRRSDAWGKYVGQFGFTSALPKTNSPGIAAEYVLSAWRPFEMFGYAQEDQAQWGVPRDAGLREVTEWKNQFGSEFISRLWKAPDEFNEMYRDALKQYFKDVDQPGAEQNLLAKIEAANKSRNGGPTNSPLPPGQVRLPRIAELGSAQTGDIFSMPPMVFPPPLVVPDMQTISFPSGVQVKGVKSMVFHDDALWLAVEIAEPLEIKTVNSQIEKEFQPVTIDHVRLWKLDVNAQQIEPVAGPLATNDVNSMMFHGDTLWLALNDDGIAALDVKTGELKRYQSSSGINSTNQFALVNILRGIVAIGGMSDLLLLGNEPVTWTTFTPTLPHQNFSFGGDLRKIAGLKNKLLFYNSQLLLCDLISNNWVRIADPQSLDRIGRVNSMTDDGRENFWICSDSGLHSVDPNTGKIRSQWVSISPKVQIAEGFAFPGQAQTRKTDAELLKEIQQKLEFRRQLLQTRKTDTNSSNLAVPGSRLSAGVLSVAPDGDFLWVFTRESVHPLLYHPASQSWVGGFSINLMGTPSVLACGGGKLWLATQSGENIAIFEIDAGALKSIPRERWLPDNVAQEEFAARISGLPEPERALFYFFAGDDMDAIRLFQTRKEMDLDAQSLFLLHTSFDEMGEPNQADRYAQKLTNDFPDSIFTKILSSNRRRKESEMKISGRLNANPQPESNAADAVSAWMLLTSDVDGDSALDKDELTIFFEFEPEQIQRFAFNPTFNPANAAAELLRRCDENQDGRLQRDELIMGLGNHLFFRNIPWIHRTNSPAFRRTQTTNQ
jgi:hypothetical protein